MNKKNSIINYQIILVVLFLTVVGFFVGIIQTNHASNIMNNQLRDDLLKNNDSINMYHLIYNSENNNQSNLYYDLNNSEKISYNNYLINKNDNTTNTIIIDIISLLFGGLFLIYFIEYLIDMNKMKKKKRKRSVVKK